MCKLAGLVTGLFIFGMVGMANALSIDFRDTAWGGANGVQSYTVDGVTAGAAGKEPHDKEFLYQDTTDGLGILGGEDDEIDGYEWLAIFLPNLDVSGFMVTDLFASPDGNNLQGEHGEVYLFNGSSEIGHYDFYGENSHQGNGEQYIDFGGIIADVTLMQFYTKFPLPGEAGHEYSVAGIDIAPVPEPATMLLFGTGLVGLAGVTSRRRKKQHHIRNI